ncbi:L-lactate transporter-like isoform X2 [Littorina saxatilis]|uniref:Major facilitator superfamily (MFS) profile domain-containing protein n=1 Tax=Littorina saxatilis TaxID=31220 RepID=A0AAN9APU0_9CAEN
MAVACRACLVIVAGILIHLTLGTLYTFGNLTPYLTSYIRKRSSPSDLTYGQSVWINAVAAMGQGASMFFGGLMEKRLGPRLTVLLGAWFQSLGVMLTYFAIQYSFAATTITYGLMFGLGIGIAYAVPMAVGMRWLPKRKGLVNGCVVAGFGGGAFIFDQIQTAYINPNNLSPDLTINGDKFFTQDDILDKVPMMFIILGGTYAVMQLIGCLLLTNPPDLPVSYFQLAPSDEENSPMIPESESGDSRESPEQGAAAPASVNSSSKSTEQLVERSTEPIDENCVSPRDVFKEPAFYILWFIFLVNGQGVQFISSLYKAYGQTFIKDDVFLAWVGALAAVCNAGGRIMWGSFADRYSFKVAMMCLCCLFTVLMLTLGVTSLAGRWMFLVWICLLFLAFSGSFSLMPTACARSFGQTHYAKNYGLLFTSQVITSPISAVLTSSLKSAIGWYGMFYMVAAFSFISFILTISFKKKMPDGKDV